MPADLLPADHFLSSLRGLVVALVGSFWTHCPQANDRLDLQELMMARGAGARALTHCRAKSRTYICSAPDVVSVDSDVSTCMKAGSFPIFQTCPQKKRRLPLEVKNFW